MYASSLLAVSYQEVATPLPNTTCMHMAQLLHMFFTIYEGFRLNVEWMSIFDMYGEGACGSRCRGFGVFTRVGPPGDATNAIKNISGLRR